MSEASSRLILADAMALLLERNHPFPVITNYQLALIVFSLLHEGEVDGRRLRARPRIATRDDLYAARNGLLKRGTFKTDKTLPSSVSRIVDSNRSDPEAVLSAIDPFGFISHLSAMAFHGLSNRLPKIIFFTTLSAAVWRAAAEQKMEQDLGDRVRLYLAQGLPFLRRIAVERVQGVPVNYIRTSARGGFRLANEGKLRVTTIGRTFLDMLRRPELCGGMSHVIEILEARGRDYAAVIINELERSGAPIDCVRAGYILEERCGITDPRLDAWVAHAQRGGSRRLDPHSEYSPQFSERWQISINV